MELEDMNPTDVRWEIIKDVYNKNVISDIKKQLTGSPAAVIMMFCMSFVPRLKFENDEELLEIQNRLYEYHLKLKEKGNEKEEVQI